MNGYNAGVRFSNQLIDATLKEFNKCLKNGSYNDIIKKHPEFKQEMKPKYLQEHLLNKLHYNFIPTMFESEILDKFKKQMNKDKYIDGAIKFFTAEEARIKELHDKYYKIKRLAEGKSINYYDEIAKRKLIDLAILDRPKPMNSKELINAMKTLLLTNGLTMSFKEMDAIYKRNLPSKTIKSPKLIANESPIITSTNKDNNEEDKPGIYFKRSPWKSKWKVNEFSKRYNIENVDEMVEHRKNSFKRYDNTKKYALMTIGPKDSVIIDYFFPGGFVYLLAIKINSRKAFAIPAPIITEQTEGRWVVPTKGTKTIESTIECLKKLLKKTPISQITCDKEGAFESDDVKDFCKKHGIKLRTYNKNDMTGIMETNDKSRGNHSSLVTGSLTMREMNYLVTGSLTIDPHTMKYLLDEYNNSVHSMLSKIMKRNITPNMMEENQELRDEYCRRVIRENIKKAYSDDFNIKGLVYIMNDANPFDKIKPKLLPGKWLVSGRSGSSFICKQGDKKFIAPRWMIKDIV